MFFQATAHVSRSVKPRSSVPYTRSSPETGEIQYDNKKNKKKDPAHVQVGIIFQQSMDHMWLEFLSQRKWRTQRPVGTNFLDIDVNYNPCRLLLLSTPTQREFSRSLDNILTRIYGTIPSSGTRDLVRKLVRDKPLFHVGWMNEARSRW